MSAASIFWMMPAAHMLSSELCERLVTPTSSLRYSPKMLVLPSGSHLRSIPACTYQLVLVVIAKLAGCEVDAGGAIAAVEEQAGRHMLHDGACTPPLALTNRIGGSALSARDSIAGAERLVGAFAVAERAGELEVADLAAIVQSQIPHVVLTPGGRTREACKGGSVVTDDVAQAVLSGRGVLEAGHDIGPARRAVEDAVLAKAELAEVDASSLEVGDVAGQQEVDVVDQLVGRRIELADRDFAELFALDEPGRLYDR